MPVLESRLNPRSAEFVANAAAMRALVDDLNTRLARIAQGGGEAARAKHLARGKLLPRERVEMLLDPDTRAAGLYNPHKSAPYTVVIGRDGKIASEKSGYEPGAEVALEAELVALLKAPKAP